MNIQTSRPVLWYASVLNSPYPRHPERLTELKAMVDRQRTSRKGVDRRVLDGERFAAIWLLEGLYQAYFSQPRAMLALPMSERFYNASYRTPVPHPFGAVKKILAAAESLGWLKVDVGSHDPEGKRGRVTTVEASGELATQFEQDSYEWRLLDAPLPDRLILLAEDSEQKVRREIRNDEAPQVSQWRSNIQRINELLLSHCICLDGSNDVILDVGVSRSAHVSQGRVFGPTPLNFSQVTLRRIFARGRLDRGGRFYGGWWQSVPSRYRKYIAIDGELATEADFSAMALRCLYAIEGKDVGNEDLYDVGLSYASSSDPRRKIVKRYVNAVLNDEKGTYRLPHEEQRILGINAKELRTRITTRHEPIAHHFHTGIGLRLQFLESEIAEQVMLRLADENEVCLPIHDSFLVRHGIIERLVNLMAEEFERKLGRKGRVIPDEVFLGERMAIPAPEHIPKGFSVDEQANALASIHWRKHSIATGYYTSWVAQNKTLETIDAEFQRNIAIWQELRPQIAELTSGIHFP